MHQLYEDFTNSAKLLLAVMYVTEVSSDCAVLKEAYSVIGIFLFRNKLFRKLSNFLRRLYFFSRNRCGGTTKKFGCSKGRRGSLT